MNCINDQAFRLIPIPFIIQKFFNVIVFCLLSLRPFEEMQSVKHMIIIIRKSNEMEPEGCCIVSNQVLSRVEGKVVVGATTQLI